MSKWILTRISEMAEILSGGTPKTEIAEYWNGNIPWLSVKDFSGDAKHVYTTEKNITELGLNNSATQLLFLGDIIISARGTVGEIAQVGNTMAFNQSCYGLRAKQGYSSDFLYYALKYQIKYLKTVANGAVFDTIILKTFDKMKTNVPKLTVQQKISDILSTYDDLIENNNKRIKILEQMAENLYKEWFVRFRFPGYETTTFKSGTPSNWTIKKLKDFGRIETGKTPSTAKPENYGNAYHFVKTPDMHGNIFVIKTEEMLSEIGNNSQIKKLLPINSIMVSCIGSAGIVAINTKPAHTNQQINSIILDKPYELEWLYFTCKELKGTIQSFGANGATMTNLNKGKFEKLKVYYPTPEIISKFHQIVEPMFSELKSLLTINENLIKQRDLLLPRLMSGKLEVEYVPK